METTLRARKRGVGQATSQPTIEEYKPSYDWTEDPTNHVLLLDLTGFKKDDLKLQVDNLDKITASGERSVSDKKRILFKQTFQIPKGSDVSKISGKFDNGLLFVIIPKKETEKKDEDQKVAQKDATKEEMPKEETEKMVTKKDGTKEEMPTEKKEGIQKGKSMKEGMPARKEQEKVQKETAMEEAKPTIKEQDKTMGEGMPKDEEQEEAQDDITAKEGIRKEEEMMSSGKKVEEMPEEKEEEIPEESKKVEEMPEEKEEEIPEESTEEEMQTKKEEEPEADGGSRSVSKNGPKDSSDDKKEESKIEGGRQEVKTKCGEGHKFKDLGEKMYERGKELLGDDFCDSVMKKINDNKAIIATAVVAFSLGFYVSSKLKRSE